VESVGELCGNGLMGTSRTKWSNSLPQMTSSAAGKNMYLAAFAVVYVILLSASVLCCSHPPKSARLRPWRFMFNVP
jgi:hypothetical protein